MSVTMEGQFSRNLHDGSLGDMLEAVIFGGGYKIMLMQRNLRLLCAQFGVASQEVLQAFSLFRRTSYGGSV